MKPFDLNSMKETHQNGNNIEYKYFLFSDKQSGKYYISNILRLVGFEEFMKVIFERNKGLQEKYDLDFDAIFKLIEQTKQNMVYIY